MSRCKACNNILSPSEIIWDEARKKHEELCGRCRRLLGFQLDEVFLTEEELLLDTTTGIEEEFPICNVLQTDE